MLLVMTHLLNCPGKTVKRKLGRMNINAEMAGRAYFKASFFLDKCACRCDFMLWVTACDCD